MQASTFHSGLPQQSEADQTGKADSLRSMTNEKKVLPLLICNLDITRKAVKKQD